MDQTLLHGLPARESVPISMMSFLLHQPVTILILDFSIGMMPIKLSLLACFSISPVSSLAEFLSRAKATSGECESIQGNQPTVSRKVEVFEHILKIK